MIMCHNDFLYTFCVALQSAYSHFYMFRDFTGTLFVLLFSQHRHFALLGIVLWTLFFSFLLFSGIVLGTLFVGGKLMSQNQLKPGDLMSFMVATQTLQRSGTPLSYTRD